MLVVNDIGEFLWGWPDFEFSVDNSNPSKYLNINIDLVVATPCGYLSVDLRDAMGDQLFLSATTLQMSGTLAVKRVTANLHITGLGHGYASFSHVGHKQMNFSHIVTEFSLVPIS
ncbi:hypothetical protein BYT27DRAFT_7245629 [Phlegmacium glaucopus]|nr:hypothetical protein BYT27DRAFT_7245629 [Phlegmacium glaucopus]